MAVLGTGEAASRFARLLGLDPTKTRKMRLKIDANEIITIDVEMMPDEKDLEAIIGELKQFELVEKEDV